MEIHEYHDSFVAIGDKVRVELGHRRVDGVADKDTLSNKFTAKHYRATPIDPKTGKPFLDEHGRPIVVYDAAGKVIEADKPFQYLDHKQKHGGRVWHIYSLTEVEPERQVPDLSDPDDPDATRTIPAVSKWIEVATVDGDKETALAEAQKYVGN